MSLNAKAGRTYVSQQDVPKVIPAASSMTQT